jgi:D-alanyl-D-alanine carboxypeptidase
MLNKIFASLIIVLSAVSGIQMAEKPETDYYFKPFFNPSRTAAVLPALEERQSSFFIQKEVPPQFLPERENMLAPEIEIKAGIITKSDGTIIYGKNIDERLSIASVTKLLTALVALENLELDAIVEITKNAVRTYGENGDLIVGEKLSVYDLLQIMLISSSNDAAVALGDEMAMSGKSMPDLMNKKAKDIGMKNFSFYDPAGLDAKNSATAADLAALSRVAVENEVIKKIIGIEKIDIFDVEKKFIHHIESTNKLFGRIDNLIGGKTGYTSEAGECLVVAVNLSSGKVRSASSGQDYFVAAILGAKEGERFNDMEKLVDWAKLVYGL